MIIKLKKGDFNNFGYPVDINNADIHKVIVFTKICV